MIRTRSKVAIYLLRTEHFCVARHNHLPGWEMRHSGHIFSPLKIIVLKLITRADNQFTAKMRVSGQSQDSEEASQKRTTNLFFLVAILLAAAAATAAQGVCLCV